MIDEKKLIEEIEKRINFWKNRAATEESEFGAELKMVMVAEATKILDMVNEQPKVGEWIPCSERLPEPYDMVNITAKMPDHKEALVYMGSIDGSKQWYILGVTNPNDYNVTAWMPLPEPWEGEEQNDTTRD